MKTPNGDFSDGDIRRMARSMTPTQIRDKTGLSVQDVVNILVRLGIDPFGDDTPPPPPPPPKPPPLPEM